MPDAGELAEYVGSGQITLTNTTGVLTFKQLHNVQAFIHTSYVTHQLTDSTMEKLKELRDFAIEADIWLTEPELVAWVAYTLQSNNNPPSNTFTISYTGDDTNATTLASPMFVADLNFIDNGEGYAIYHVRLESETGVVTAA